MRHLSLIISLYLISFLISSVGIAAEEHNFLNTKTQIKDPYSMRDPFKRKLPTKAARLKVKERSRGIFNNSMETVETKHTDTLKIVGVILGKERRAMAKDASGKETFIIKEGMKIGPNDAEVKAILPGGVVLVEKIKNIYDQDEYLETVLPITGN